MADKNFKNTPKRQPAGRPAHRPKPEAAKPAAPVAKPELLAPAGSLEAFAAAIDAGADAVYVGAHQFNARLRAKNFTREELACMVKLAHDRGRRVYITLNTLVKEGELSDLARLLDDLRRMGPDALIIQEFGVFRLARRICPEIPLHASTQMTIHNLDGALQAQRMGLQRAILARELSVEEIRAIRASSTIELECFVHGAMCYSIAGQCLFSRRLHGKSANRGRCLQPCRRIYDHETEGPASSYSMRDMCAAPVLDRVLSAGMCSLKIEGRLKPAETISQIVRAYRLLIDAWPRISREVNDEARALLETAIGRAPTTAFYLNTRPDTILGGIEAQSGRWLGTTGPARPGYFSLRPTAELKTGDRLRVRVKPNEPPKGFTIREIVRGDRVVKRSPANVPVELLAPFDIPEGAGVVKAADTDAKPKGFEKRIEALVAEMTEPARTALPVRLAVDGRGIQASAEPWGVSVQARQPFTHRGELSPAELTAILGGGAASVRLAPVPDPGAPETLDLSAEDAEKFRDHLLHRIESALDRQRDAALGQAAAPVEIRPRDDGRARWVLAASLAQAEALAKLPAFRTGAEQRATYWMLPLSAAADPRFAAFAASLREGAAAGVQLPPFYFEPHKKTEVETLLHKALDGGARAVTLSNPGHFTVLRNLGKRRIQVLSLPNIGCLNSACHAQLSEWGADAVTLSLECDRETLDGMMRRVPAKRMAVTVFGTPPLFQSRVPGPIPQEGRLSLREPRVELRVIHQGGLTITLEPRPFCANQEQAGLLRELDWVYDFIHTDLAPDQLAQAVNSLENHSAPPVRFPVVPHPLDRDLE